MKKYTNTKNTVTRKLTKKQISVIEDHVAYYSLLLGDDVVAIQQFFQRGTDTMTSFIISLEQFPWFNYSLMPAILWEVQEYVAAYCGVILDELAEESGF